MFYLVLFRVNTENKCTKFEKCSAYARTGSFGFAMMNFEMMFFSPKESRTNGFLCFLVLRFFQQWIEKEKNHKKNQCFSGATRWGTIPRDRLCRSRNRASQFDDALKSVRPRWLAIFIAWFRMNSAVNSSLSFAKHTQDWYFYILWSVLIPRILKAASITLAVALARMSLPTLISSFPSFFSIM